MPENIVLIGLMGAGKSVVGRKLADLLGRRFLDVDHLIQEHEVMPIADIFARLGEDYFRGVETEMVGRAAEEELAVISCGGGALLRSGNAEKLKSSGRVVYLKADPDELARRLGPQDGIEVKARPMLAGNDVAERIRRLLAEREPLYLAHADIVFDTAGLTPDEVARGLVRALEEKGWLSGGPPLPVDSLAEGERT